jgi:hypothetical protein
MVIIHVQWQAQWIEYLVLILGRKELPDDGDDMLDLLNVLCRYCGWFIRKSRLVNKQVTSKTWQKALDNYKKNKPMLSRY